MQFCVSTGVGTWTNCLTFEPDPDHSPDAGTGKSEIDSRSNRHLTRSRLQVTGCTVERYCLLHVVVQGPGSFRCRLNFLYDVRLRSYGASNLSNFRILASVGGTCAPPSALLVIFDIDAICVTRKFFTYIRRFCFVHVSPYLQCSNDIRHVVCVCVLYTLNVLFLA